MNMDCWYTSFLYKPTSFGLAAKGMFPLITSLTMLLAQLNFFPC